APASSVRYTVPRPRTMSADGPPSGSTPATAPPTPAGGPSGSGTPPSGDHVSPPSALDHARWSPVPPTSTPARATAPPSTPSTTAAPPPRERGTPWSPPSVNVSPPSSGSVTPHRPAARTRPGWEEPGGRATKASAPLGAPLSGTTDA